MAPYGGKGGILHLSYLRNEFGGPINTERFTITSFVESVVVSNIFLFPTLRTNSQYYFSCYDNAMVLNSLY
jgi:hypothetical protein